MYTIQNIHVHVHVHTCIDGMGEIGMFPIDYCLTRYNNYGEYDYFTAKNYEEEICA